MNDYFYSLEECLHRIAVRFAQCGGHELNCANAIRYALYFIQDENNQ